MKSSFSSCPQHETFEELAALDAVGELSGLEQQRLRHHLTECPHCADWYEAIADVAANDLGVVATKRESNARGIESADDPEGREHLERLRHRLETDRARIPKESGQLGFGMELISSARERRVSRATYRQVAYGIAATLLLAVAVPGGIALWRWERAAVAARTHSRELQLALDSLKQDKKAERAASDNAVIRSLEESQRARDTLQKSLAAAETKNGELLARETATQEKLAGAIAAAEHLRQELQAKESDRDRLAKLQQESDTRLHEALAELHQARQAGIQGAANAEAHNTNFTSNSQPALVGSLVPVSASELEARNLFGARDLHIVDVYDVAGDGQTKRTYGRVYYVEKKLLVFYAFDLENRQNHKRGVFQAWGYREANLGKPQSLGQFTIDDSTASRWVLTVDRADVLSHIDAVFVTVEPDGGSTAPRGKKVLYANLIGPPNHP
ncbi:MAG TPA: zf-HC2 domain-containing protein [Candidatus Acidoferrum sp.]|nr:zf-HC2 domain-containing protein [Candidatus Acidoferrum sp.]